ncbi:MAG: ribosome maturation factor RimP [Trueperaceae bacterium]
MMDELQDAAKHILEPLGYEVLEVTVTGQGKKRKVLLRIDRLDEKTVSMEDVTLATRIYGLELDRLDPFDTPYELEVESPGPQRPLFTQRHLERFHDLEVKVKTRNETFRGIIRTVQDDTVTFQVGKELKTYLVSEIHATLAEWPKEPR